MKETLVSCVGDKAAIADLMGNLSLEITARDAEQIAEAAPLLPKGTAVSVTYLPNENFAGSIDAAIALRRIGLTPVPHISARRLASGAELEVFLERLAIDAQVDRIFVVAGDIATANGPYVDSLSVLRSGLLSRYGIRRVGIAGYPGGHPQIASPLLWQALRDKQSFLRDEGLEGEIVTQFGFDADPVIDWLAELRAKGIDLPVRLGLAGPANIKTLLRFASRCGVGVSAKAMGKYGMSLTRLLGNAGPERMLTELATRLDKGSHGEVMLHFYPFGGLGKTAAWIADRLKELS